MRRITKKILCKSVAWNDSNLISFSAPHIQSKYGGYQKYEYEFLILAFSTNGYVQQK